MVGNQYKYGDLIQRSFVENYVDVPGEARAELREVYSKAELYNTDAPLLASIIDIITQGDDDEPQQVVTKLKQLISDYQAYLRIEALKVKAARDRGENY